MAGKKKKTTQEKKERKSLKCWAKGARESVLSPHIEPYADALARGWRQEREYHRLVCNEFHATFSWRLKDFEEPPLPLPKYDPNAMANEERLSETELAERDERIALLNARIRRWLRYRVDLLQGNLGVKMDPKKNPYAPLLARLSGCMPPVKARQGWQQYMHESYHTAIQDEVDKQWARKVEKECLAGDSIPNAPFRAQVARSMFNSMAPEEQEAIKNRAKANAAIMKAEFEAAMLEKPPYSPIQKQRAIDNLAAFLNPIMRGVEEKTGYKLVVMYGGSTPRSNGEICANYLAWGKNLTNSPTHFPQWDKDDFKMTLDRFRTWLATAYTTKEMADNAIKVVDLDDAPHKIDDILGTDIESGGEEEEEEEEEEVNDEQGKASTKKRGRSKKGGKQVSSKSGSRKRSTKDRDQDAGDNSQSLGTSPAPAKKKRRTESSYSPFDPANPDGDLIPPPDPSIYQHMKAYNTAKTARAVAGIREDLTSGFEELFGSQHGKTRDGLSSSSPIVQTNGMSMASPTASRLQSV